MRVEEEESTSEEAPASEEAQANGDVAEEQLQVSDFLMWKMFYHQLLCLNVFIMDPWVWLSNVLPTSIV